MICQKPRNSNVGLPLSRFSFYPISSPPRFACSILSSAGLPLQRLHPTSSYLRHPNSAAHAMGQLSFKFPPPAFTLLASFLLVFSFAIQAIEQLILTAAHAIYCSGWTFLSVLDLTVGLVLLRVLKVRGWWTGGKGKEVARVKRWEG